jgi:acyl-CoA synthetase (AMP-forming)/AMP-acid ligase II
MTHRLDSLITLLELRAAEQGSNRAYTFLTDGERESDTLHYGQLATNAKAIAATLAERGLEPGDRALLLYAPGLDFIEAFFGCLYAGVIAVPAYPPHSAQLARTLPRLLSVTSDADVAIVLCTRSMAALAPELGKVAPLFRTLTWLATNDVPREAGTAWCRPPVDRDSLAFLQYTSGSTSAPKGVMVSHGNLLHNLAGLNHLEANDVDSVSVSWLPVIHDMGLIEGVLVPMYADYPAYLMSPESFLQRPMRWLQAITRYRGTNSGGPNFAYDLCVRKSSPPQREMLDLSTWRCAYNGAEPIRRDTLVRFHETFRSTGFQWKSFYPVYGLAESTLLVTSGGRDDEPLSCDADADALAQGVVRNSTTEKRRATPIVACGPVWSETKLRIVDPETCVECAPGSIGEIWIASESVAQGYWRRPEQSALTFGARLANGAGPWLRTGDLGTLYESELLVTGRLKDLLIVRGSKHYPQDLELTSERQHAAIRAGCCAAFTVDGIDGDAIALAAEIDARQLDIGTTQLHDIAASIRRAVVEQHGVQLHAIALLKPGTLPKTTSGKLQRHACRAAFAGRKLEELHRWTRVIASRELALENAS